MVTKYGLKVDASYAVTVANFTFDKKKEMRLFQPTGLPKHSAKTDEEI